MKNDKEAYLIYLRNGPLVLSKVRYAGWRDIQDDYEHYMTSLGPGNEDDIVSFLKDEYKDESGWAFSQQQIQAFMRSQEFLLFEEGFELLDLRSRSATALQFQRHINDQDLDGLFSMMTDDHIFIDASDEVSSGKDTSATRWHNLFKAYPDCQNIIESVEHRDSLVIMIGHCKCLHPKLAGPAIWTAKVVDGLVSEWRVFLDSFENRILLEIH